MGWIQYLLVTWSVISNLMMVKTSEIIAGAKTANQSSVYGSLDSSKAIDGCNITKIASGCCTHTQAGQTEAWWQVDLQKQFVIESVHIIYREEGTLNRLAGYEIFLSNTTTWELDDRCYKDTTPNLGAMSASSVVTCPGVAKYLTIYNDRRETTEAWYSSDAVLELCEVYVYGCPIGRYGTGHCNKPCTNCFGNICHPTSGTCYVCTAGFYKIDVNCSLCPINCVGNVCHSVTGACLAGCSMGYTGTKCGCPLNCRDDNCPITYGHCYDCNDGYYGPTCTQCPSGCGTDTCDKTSGHCLQCDVKLYGKFCNQSCRGDCKNNICEMDSGLCRECKLGYYGIECNLSCPSNCQGKLCDRKSGECAVCIAGYHSSWCDEDCGHCQGDKCGKDKGCEDGWTGDTCEIKVVTVMNEDAAVGIGVGLGVIILVLVIVIVVLVRHLSFIQRDTKSPVYMTDVPSSSNEQTLSRNQDHSYINVPNRVQHFSDISTTERNYEQLGPREVYIPNIYETTNVD